MPVTDVQFHSVRQARLAATELALASRQPPIIVARAGTLYVTSSAVADGVTDS